MEERIHDFLTFLSDERGFSFNTLAAYRNDLLQFLAYLEGLAYDDRPANWPSVTPNHLLGYVLSLRERNYAPATVARKVAAARSYFHFLRRHGSIGIDPTEKLDSPKVIKARPKTLSVEEVIALLDAPSRLSSPEALRDRAMFEVLYATGMRVTELVSLNLEDVDLLSGYVRCVGKNGRERQMPLPDRATDALNVYLTRARPPLLRAAGENALFLNHRGERLTRQGFWLIIKAHARSAGIEADITPHTLRHSVAAHMITGGADLRSVQELLGHVSISSTQVYSDLAREMSGRPA
jgi:integrase/recombinase XerD